MTQPFDQVYTADLGLFKSEMQKKKIRKKN